MKKKKILMPDKMGKQPEALLEEAHLDEYQITTNDLDLLGKNHHSIWTLEQPIHFPCPNHKDGSSPWSQIQQGAYYPDWHNA